MSTPFDTAEPLSNIDPVLPPTPQEAAAQQSPPEDERYKPLSNIDSADSSDQQSNGMQAGSYGAAAGAILPSGNYDFEDSVADWARGEARKTAGDALAESYESGIYDNQSADFLERSSYDEVGDLVEGYQDTGRLVTGEEAAEGLNASRQALHWEGLASTPQAGVEPSNINIGDFQDHFFGDHRGDWTNNPAEFNNPDYNVDPVAEQELGEANLNVVSDAEAFKEVDVAPELGEGLEPADLWYQALKAGKASALEAPAVEGALEEALVGDLAGLEFFPLMLTDNAPNRKQELNQLIDDRTDDLLDKMSRWRDSHPAPEPNPWGVHGRDEARQYVIHQMRAEAEAKRAEAEAKSKEGAFGGQTFGGMASGA